MPLTRLQPRAADPLLALIAAYERDLWPEKLDLGVGVFRDTEGRTPVMAAVRHAEARLLEMQTTKAYLGPEGDRAYSTLLSRMALGAELARPLFGLQTPGGTGALRLAADLIASAGVERVWVAGPTWPNHLPILKVSRLAPQVVDIFDSLAQRFDFERFVDALRTADAGDAVLLHGCCHNPTGLDPSGAAWAAIAEVVAERGLLPLIDLAYQGLGDGWEADAAGVRQILAASPQALIAYSCDKNFGLYRERTGALWASAATVAGAEAVQSNLLALARANWSMPPDHGAAVVRLILESEDLTATWQNELEGMRRRLVEVRRELAAHGQVAGIDLAGLAEGKGMFATLPLPAEAIGRLRDRHGIYLAGSGRISVAGFGAGGVAKFRAALDDVMAGLPA